MVAYKSSKNGAPREPFLGYKLSMMLSNQLVLSDDSLVKDLNGQESM
jgi:hypothetical protein